MSDSFPAWVYEMGSLNVQFFLHFTSLTDEDSIRVEGHWTTETFEA